MVSLVEYNFTLNNTSPMFKYSPLSDESDASQGWETIRDTESGSTYRFTKAGNASLSLSFFGTGVTLFGTSNASYAATLDGRNSSVPSPGGNILFQSDCAEQRHYRVKLTIVNITGSQVFRFDNATVTSQVLSKNRFPIISNFSSNAKSMETHGTWHDRNDHNRFALNPYSNVTIRATTSPGDSMSFSVQGRAVAIYGPVNASTGLFSVTHKNRVHVLNASSSIPLDETLLFYEDGLSESNKTTLQLTNLGIGETALCVSRVQVFAFNPTNATSHAWTSNHSNSNESATIIGAVVGSILGAVILAAATITLIRMRKRRKAPAEAGPHAITPFDTGNEATGGAILRSGSKDSSSLESNPDGLQMIQLNSAATQPSVQQVSLSTVERLLLLIARQVDSVTRTGEMPGDQGRGSLPPYPASIRNRSFRVAS